MESFRGFRLARSGSRSVASRSSTGWTSTPSAARCSPSSARTAPESRRLSRSSPATTRPTPARSRSAGEAHAALDPVTARRLGVVMIFQELPDAPHADRGREHLARPAGRPARARPLARRCVGARRHVLDELDVDIDPDAPGRHAPRRRAPDRRDRARPVRRCPLPDPRRADGGALAPGGQRLFGFIRRLREQGVAIVYITHRLDEVSGHRRPRAGAARRRGRAELAGSRRRTARRWSRRWSAGASTEFRDRRRDPRRPSADAGHPLRAAAARQGEFRTSTSTSAPGEVVALYGKLGSGTAEVAEAAFGAAPAHGRHARAPGRARARSRARRRRSTRASASSRPTARRGRRSWSAPSRRTWRSPSWPRLGRAAACSSAQRAEARAYRRWHDELSIRSRNDPRPADRDAVGRQPAEGAARPLAGARRREVLRARRADARRRCRRPRRTSTGRCASSPPRASPSSSHVRLRGGRPGRRPRVRDGARPRRGAS